MLKKLIKSLTPPIFLNIYRTFLAVSRNAKSLPAEEQEIRRLEKLPKGVSEIAKMPIAEFQITDPQSFVEVYRDYFCRGKFEFSADTSLPFIIDCGANVGVSVLYWKSLYPDSRILAFEPDPTACRALRLNCRPFSDIEIHEAAVWIADGTTQFAAVGSDGGHLSNLTEMRSEIKQLDVKTTRLKNFIRQHIDMLKIDIEGAEVEVLKDCADSLGNVQRLFVEYHSFEGARQNLGEFFSILEGAGFRIHIHTDMPSSSPFKSIDVFNKKDLRLNCYCVRK
jgi:FkbM family methyltransferase